MAEVGMKPVFENERVRVWEFTLQAGETVETHKHDHDYIFLSDRGRNARSHARQRNESAHAQCR